MSDESIKPGTLIVGASEPNESAFTQNGARKLASTMSGSVDKMQEAIRRSASRVVGAEVSVVSQASKVPVEEQNKKRGRKTKTATTVVQPYVFKEEFVPPVKPAVIEHKTIQFENAFGRIKAKVEAVLDSDTAIALVYSSEDDMVFEPKLGETLYLYDENKDKHEVFYPGTIFDWTDGVKKIIILVKTRTESQE